MNQSGMLTAEDGGEKMMQNIELTKPPRGDERDLAKLRLEYAQDPEPVGSIPEPTPPGIAAVLMDKLGERLAFERSGTRLYDALLAKHQAELSNTGHGSEGADLVSRDTLLEFRNQEAEHFLLVSQAITRLGGDPTAQTPCADAVGMMSIGLMQTVTDPRTSLPQSLGAILTAELTDVASWELLAKLAQAMGQDEMARSFREALQQEEKHLRVIREWHTALIMGESGNPKSGTRGTIEV